MDKEKLTSKPSNEEQKTFSQIMQESHALIKKKRQEGLQAAEEILKQRLSSEEWLPLIRANKEARTKN